MQRYQRLTLSRRFLEDFCKNIIMGVLFFHCFVSGGFVLFLFSNENGVGWCFSSFFPLLCVWLFVWVVPVRVFNLVIISPLFIQNRISATICFLLKSIIEGQAFMSPVFFLGRRRAVSLELDHSKNIRLRQHPNHFPRKKNRIPSDDQ